MNETGIQLYDLAPPACPECGQFLGSRWLMTGDSGCGTCDEAVTRHRCVTCPPLSSMTPGESWACPDCDSVWTAADEDEPCGECGQAVKRKAWSVVVGDRIATAPRYKPVAFTPFRDLGRAVQKLAEPPAYSAWDGTGDAFSRPGSCYRARAGFLVHVRPGCRCPR